MKKRAFVRYSKQGKIVPGSLILTSGSFPNGPSTWNEVPADLCCTTPCGSEPLVMEVRTIESFFEFGFRVYNGNTVKGTIEWGDGQSETFDLSGGGYYTYFGHNYTTPDYIPQTIRVYFTSVAGFRNLEIGDTDGWHVLSVTNIPAVFAGSTINQVDADGSLLTTLDVSGLTSLTELYALECPNLAYLNVQGCTSLDDTELFSDAFETLDFSGCMLLVSARIYDNSNLTQVIIDTCPSLAYLDAIDCALSTANVDYLITTLDNNGRLSGYLDVSGGTSGAPSGGVASNILSLTSKGWNVYTN